MESLILYVLSNPINQSLKLIYNSPLQNLRSPQSALRQSKTQYEKSCVSKLLDNAGNKGECHNAICLNKLIEQNQ